MSRSTSSRSLGWRLLGLALRIVLLVTVVVGLALAFYGVHLDQIIREKFEGQRWALPARVYSRPLELYVDRLLTPAILEAELERLKYRLTDQPSRPGHYRRSGDQFILHTQGFQFWDGAEPERELRLRFADGVLSAITDIPSNRELALVRLEPALIANIYPTHNEDRILLTRQQLPEQMIKTLLAVEDRDFFRHFGLDLRGIVRAAYRNLRAGRTVEGASTLTQQLVKNFYLSHQRTLERKFNEAYMAILLERHYSKNEILTAYANEVYMGQDGQRAIHGFALASRFYFDTPLDELSDAQIALLVAILKGPSEYNPRRHPDRVQARRNLVLDIMAHHRIISPEAAALAKAEPLGIRDGGARPIGEYPAFIDLVRRQLQRDYREADLRSEGLHIFTTLDPLVQQRAEESIRERLPEFERQRRLSADTLEAAAVVTSVSHGEVLALVGGRNTGFHGFNRAVNAVRSIGSLIKPVIYLVALNQPERYSVVSLVADEQVNLRIGNQVWRPQNYNRREHGQVPLYEALAKSYNLAAVNLGLELGVEQVADHLRKLGAMRTIETVPALLLGSVSLTPLEVAQIYQTLAAGGFRAPLRTIREIVDADGQPLSRYPLAIEQVVNSEAVSLTQWTMQKAVSEGTGAWLNQRLPKELVVAGKTGTTNELRDSWFAGFSADHVAVVWVGRDDNQSSRLTGASGALRIWGDLMATIDNQPLPDALANGLTFAPVCGRSASVPFHAQHVGVGVRCAREREASPAQDEMIDEMPAEHQDAPPAEPQPSPRRPTSDNLFLHGF